MPSTSLRTIWITLRATNYTSAVFNSVIRQCDTLEKKEKMLVSQNLRLGTSALSAGMMFYTMGEQMGGPIGQAMQMASTLAFVTSAFGYARAAILFTSKVMTQQGIVTKTLTISWTMLGLAIMSAIAGLVIVIAITNTFGRTAGLVTGLAMSIIGLALAWSFLKAVLSHGGTAALDMASAIGIGLMAAGLMGSMYAFTKHQMGSRMISATGPSILHAGEVVYNPATRRPTQIANELEEGEGGRTVIYQMPITIENVNTKASMDDVDERFGQAIKKATNRSK